jgi:hypothetical protein
VGLPVSLALGSHQLTATWSGTDRRAGSTSAAAPLAVAKGASSVALDVPRKVSRKQAVDLVATVTGSATGTVTFRKGDRVIGTAPVVNGVATLTVSFKKAGRYDMVAGFDGTAAVAASTSAVDTVKVKKTKKRR